MKMPFLKKNLNPLKPIGLDFSSLENKTALFIPVVSAYLHWIENNLIPEIPSIIVLDESFRVIDNPFIAPKIHDFLARVRKKNTIVIFATDEIADLEKSSITDLLMKEITTGIYLPTQEVKQIYKKVFKLNKDEYKMLDQIKSNSRQFLLKHADDAIVAELDLIDFDDIISILSSDEDSIEAFSQIKEGVGEDPNQWFPMIQKILAESEEE